MLTNCESAEPDSGYARRALAAPERKVEPSKGTCCRLGFAMRMLIRTYPNLNCIVSNSVIARLSLLLQPVRTFPLFFGAHTTLNLVHLFITTTMIAATRCHYGHASQDRLAGLSF